MRQVITIGAHIMNQNDQFIIFGSIINKQNRFSEQNISNLLQTKRTAEPHRNISGVKKEKEIHFYI